MFRKSSNGINKYVNLPARATVDEVNLDLVVVVVQRESRQIYEPPGHERDSVWLEKELKRIQRERQRLERERSKFLEREQK